MIQEIQQYIYDFFQNLSIDFEIESCIQEDAERLIFFVRGSSNDSKLIIGTHGANLEAITHVVTRILEKKLNQHIVLHLEVNDYLAQKDARLFHYIESKISLILRDGGSIQLSQLSPYERRKVHHYIVEKNINGLRSHSEGEGTHRTLQLIYEKPHQENQNPSINEEGIGI